MAIYWPWDQVLGGGVKAPGLLLPQKWIVRSEIGFVGQEECLEM